VGVTRDTRSFVGVGRGPRGLRPGIGRRDGCAV